MMIKIQLFVHGSLTHWDEGRFLGALVFVEVLWSCPSSLVSIPFRTSLASGLFLYINTYVRREEALKVLQ